MTTIFFNGSPIWQMHYQGSYPGTCISFLKEALTSSYRNEVWLGGRGPNVFNKDKWTYKNTPGSHCGFTNFDGSEVIINRNTGKIVGEHRYFGGSFLH